MHSYTIEDFPAAANSMTMTGKCRQLIDCFALGKSSFNRYIGLASYIIRELSEGSSLLHEIIQSFSKSALIRFISTNYI